MTGQKLGFPDSGTCDWPIEIIETMEPMQKVQENSCQSCKKSDYIWGKYTPWEISPICRMYDFQTQLRQWKKI